MNYEKEYQRLVEVGATPLDVAQVAYSFGLSITEIMRLLRSLFDLMFAQAEDVTVQAVQKVELSEYQRKYLLPLLEELDRRDFSSEQR